MRYTEPKILRTGWAIFAIQEINLTNTSDKACGVFIDASYPFPAPCTFLAYEADE